MNHTERAIIRMLMNAVHASNSQMVKQALLGVIHKIETGAHLEAEVVPGRSSRETIQLTGAL